MFLNKIIGIGGDMASGKSYLVREVMGQKRKRFKFRSVTCEMTPEKKLVCIGKYDGTKYPGTDFMYHKNLEKDILELLNRLDHDVKYRGYSIIFEGDRLFKDSFIHQLMAVYDCTFIMLRVTEDTCFRRHMKRRDNQKMQCIRDKERRNNNMLIKHPYIIPMNNNTEEEHQLILDCIASLVGETDGLQNSNPKLQARTGIEGQNATIP